MCYSDLDMVADRESDCILERTFVAMVYKECWRVSRLFITTKTTIMKQYELTEEEYNSLTSIAKEDLIPVMKIGNNWTEDTRAERSLAVWTRVAERVKVFVSTIDAIPGNDNPKLFQAQSTEEEVAP